MQQLSVADVIAISYTSSPYRRTFKLVQ